MSDLPGWLAALYRAKADIETACDKIGRLDAENDALRAEVERLRGALEQCQQMAAEGIWVPPCAERWLERIEEVAGAGRAMPDIGDLDRPHPAVIRATAAEAERDKLREALKPFADALSRYPSPPSLVGLVNDDTGGRLNVLHVDAFKAARAALQGDE